MIIPRKCYNSRCSIARCASALICGQSNLLGFVQPYKGQLRVGHQIFGQEDFSTTSHNLQHDTSTRVQEEKYEAFIENLHHYAGGNIFLNKNNETGVATVCLNNLNNKNALTGSMMHQLSDIVEDLETWKDGRVVIMHGAGDMFCSGGDLKLLMNALVTPEQGSMMSRFMHDVTSRFSRLPQLTVAAIRGRALGGGAELSTSCDFRLMDHNSEIRFVQSKLGITPGWGGCTRLVRIVGRSEALKLLLGVVSVNVELGMNINLVDGCLPADGDIVDATCAWLDEASLLSTPPDLLQNTKLMVDTCSRVGETDAMKFERKIFEHVWRGTHHNAALRKNMKHR